MLSGEEAVNCFHLSGSFRLWSGTRSISIRLVLQAKVYQNTHIRYEILTLSILSSLALPGSYKGENYVKRNSNVTSRGTQIVSRTGHIGRYNKLENFCGSCLSK